MPRVKIIITHIDNRLEVKLNGATLYDHTVDNDPALHEELDITDQLQPNPTLNQIEFSGYNAPFANPNRTSRNPWRFEYSITNGDVIVVSVRESGQNPHDDRPGGEFGGIKFYPGPDVFIPVANFELVHQRAYSIVKNP